MDVVLGFPYHTCPAPGFLLDGTGLGRLGRAAEQTGFTGVALTDHPAPSQAWREAGGHDTVDPFVGLAFVAAATTRIRLLTYVVVLPYRNPFHLAKTAASLDALSGGRFELGLGAGYLKTEFRALGIEWDERNALFDEAVAILGQAFTGAPVTYEGLHFSARGTVVMPHCVQAGGPPLWVGGNSALSLRRIVRMGAGWLTLSTPPGGALRSPVLETVDDFRRAVEKLRAYAAEQDLPAPTRIMYPLPMPHTDEEMDAHVALADEVRAAGATSLWVSQPAVAGIAEAEDWVGRYGERVLSRL